MSKSQSLGDRMKRYEGIFRSKLIPRSYTIIRLDGKAFHTFTKGLVKPFDKKLLTSLEDSTKYLFENIDGAKLAYHQSDEISLVLTDFDNLGTQGWFDGNVQKITSISSSMLTAVFNSVYKYPNDNYPKLAMFDSRVFQLPTLTEVYNYFLWRQRDGIRNSIQASAQSVYSHKELMNKNITEQEDMIKDKGELFAERVKDFNPERLTHFKWFNLPDNVKHGTFFYKGEDGTKRFEGKITQELIDGVIPLNS